MRHVTIVLAATSLTLALATSSRAAPPEAGAPPAQARPADPRDDERNPMGRASEARLRRYCSDVLRAGTPRPDGVYRPKDCADLFAKLDAGLANRGTTGRPVGGAPAPSARP